MAIVISKLLLSKFMECPVEGAHPIAPDDPPSLVNPPVNTVLPVVTGTPTVGLPLTVSTGTWTSTKTITYTYQWKRNGVDIGGATFNIYIVNPTDIAATLTVTVTAHNVGGSSSVTVAAGAGVGTPPVGGLLNSELPKITGALTVGSTLTTDNGGWVGTGTITFTYSWQRDGVDIPGATSNTYLLVAADAGHLITATVFATNGTDSNSAYSAAMGPVATMVADVTPPVISGSTVVGSTLTSTTGTWSGTPTPTFTYQWQRNGGNISGARSATYTTVLADLGTTITLVVTGTNSAGSANAVSNSLGPIVGTAPLNVTSPVASGLAVVGTTLTTTDGTWTGAAPLTYTYQWQRNGANIGGATTNSYVLVTADIGTTITVTVTATNIVGNASAVSNGIGPVVPAAVINLSNTLIAKNLAFGATVGTFSITNGTGSYSYVLNDPSGKFAISGSNLIVNAILAGGTISIIVTAIGGFPLPPPTGFNITIAALSLSSSTVPADAAIGTTIGTVSVTNGTGSYSYVLVSDPSGLFTMSGASLKVAAPLIAGSYPITISATGGVPTPVIDSFMLTVTVVTTVVSGLSSWFNGLPYPGITITANDVGSEQYWFNGLTAPQLKG